MNNFEIWSKKNLQGSRFVWVFVFILSCVSIVGVYSTTETLAYRMTDGNTFHYLVKQSFIVIMGLLIMWWVHRIDFSYFLQYSIVASVVSVILLIITFFLGTTINEATRWINIPYINLKFQPSDVAKLALIVLISEMLAKHKEDIKNIRKTVLPVLAAVGVVCGLIGLTDISTAIILFLICMIIMFIARMPMKYLLFMVGIGIIAGSAVLWLGERGATAKKRMESYQNHWNGEYDYQTTHAIIAIASGGLGGKGVGNSDQKNILPNPFSDFIFAIFIEEFGILAFILPVLYFRFLVICIRVANITTNFYKAILVLGLGFSLVLQALFHMAVNVSLLPNTGVTLPLISMGGTSHIITCVMLGIIQNISKGEIEKPKSNK